LEIAEAPFKGEGIVGTELADDLGCPKLNRSWGRSRRAAGKRKPRKGYIGDGVTAHRDMTETHDGAGLYPTAPRFRASY